MAGAKSQERELWRAANPQQELNDVITHFFHLAGAMTSLPFKLQIAPLPDIGARHR